MIILQLLQMTNQMTDYEAAFRLFYPRFFVCQQVDSHNNALKLLCKLDELLLHGLISS